MFTVEHSAFRGDLENEVFDGKDNSMGQKGLDMVLKDDQRGDDCETRESCANDKALTRKMIDPLSKRGLANF